MSNKQIKTVRLLVEAFKWNATVEAMKNTKGYGEEAFWKAQEELKKIVKKLRRMEKS
jgi:hypothetical protein